MFSIENNRRKYFIGKLYRFLVLRITRLLFMKHNLTVQKISGEVKAGLPTLQLPPISATVGNQTYGLIDMLSTIGSGSIVVPLLAILENVAIAKAFCEFSITLFFKFI